MADQATRIPLAPIGETDRIEFLDVLRGFALFGVLLANLPFFSGQVFLSDAQLEQLPTALIDESVDWLTTILVDNKFIGLFSLLFGLGFSVQLSRAESRSVDVRPAYVRRLLWLLVFGLVHGWLFWCWDILRSYALLGLLLPLFTGLAQKTLLYSSIAIGTAIPATWRSIVALVTNDTSAGDELDADTLAAFASGDYLEVLSANSAYNWEMLTSPTYGAYELFVFGRFLLGLWLGRSLIFHAPVQHIDRHRRIARWGILAGLACAAINTIIHGLEEINILEAASWGIISSFSGEISALALTLGYASGLCLLYLNSRWQARLQFFAPVGRMALTNYLMQTAISLWLFYGYMPGPNLMGQIGAALLLPIGCIIFAAQVVFSHYWLEHYRFGPMEWLWRSLTYQQLQPLRRNE